MKVDVSIIKRPAVKVEITLARGSRRGQRVSIPVRVAPYLAAEADQTDLPVFTDEPELSSDVLEEEFPVESIDEDALSEDQESDVTVTEPDETVDAAPEADPDEEELLRLIAEEEAEMEAALHKAQETEFAVPSVIEPEENEPAVAEPVNTEVDCDCKEPLIIGDIIEESTVSQPDSISMSYLDRSESGEVFEVNDVKASGQKIVCVNSESGRISRVCGFIKTNQSTDDTSEPEGSAEQDSE